MIFKKVSSVIKKIKRKVEYIRYKKNTNKEELERIILKIKYVCEKLKNIEEYKKKTCEILELSTFINEEKGFLLAINKQIKNIIRKIKIINKNVRLYLGKKRQKKQRVIMEIRAGAGGNESGLFVVSLFKMYKKYSEKKNGVWKFYQFQDQYQDSVNK